ncbi:unnamed protein product [Cuscuta epithymum]|uniref:Transposase (putative) gypsy type domain-containing protein n=2 Tax=Cuscuta epithymum TaxID=186058 RepID=A0AAV0DMI5_9ASTE|nr:unnamed protein product [Cuscuta epithymum]
MSEPPFSASAGFLQLDSAPLLSLRPRLSDNDFDLAAKMVGTGCAVSRPQASSNITDPPPKHFGIHIRSLELGFRAPISPFFLEFIRYLGVAPGQITPVGHLFLSAFEALCVEHKVVPSVLLFRYLFTWAKNGGFVYISQKPGFILFKKYPDSNKRWKDKWVWLSDPSLPSGYDWAKWFRRPVKVYPTSLDLESDASRLMTNAPWKIADLNIKMASRAERMAALKAAGVTVGPAKAKRAETSTQQAQPKVADQDPNMWSSKKSDRNRSTTSLKFDMLGTDASILNGSISAERFLDAMIPPSDRELLACLEPREQLESGLRAVVEAALRFCMGLKGYDIMVASSQKQAAELEEARRAIDEALESRNSAQKEVKKLKQNFGQVAETAKMVAELELELAIVQAKLDAEVSRHNALKESSIEAGKLAVSAYVEKDLPRLLEEHVLDNQEKIAKAWLKTPDGRKHLDMEGLINFECGRFVMQSELYEILSARNVRPEFLGLPPLMDDPDPPQSPA